MIERACEEGGMASVGKGLQAWESGKSLGNPKMREAVTEAPRGAGAPGGRALQGESGVRKWLRTEWRSGEGMEKES